MLFESLTYHPYGVFLFGVIICCLTRQNFGLDKAKLQFYSLLAGLYFHMKVDYASFLWEEFTLYFNHSKKATKIASARFWILILIEAYQQAGIQVPKGEEVVVFSHLQILKKLIDDPKVFPVIGRIPKAMLELVPLSNPILLRYREMLRVVPKVPTPKKTKSKSKGNVVITEPYADEHNKKMKGCWSVKEFEWQEAS